MIALSCCEIRRSSSATRASSVADRLSDTTTVPLSTWLASSPMMSFARSRSESDLATRLCSTMLSSRLTSSATEAPCAADWFSSILAPVLLGAQLLRVFGVLQHFRQQIFQLVVTGHLVAQVSQLGARFEQLAQRLDLLDNGFGAEVFKRTELQVDAKAATVFRQRVRHLERRARLHALHHFVKVVAVDVDELAVAQLGLLHFGLARQ
ncbi:hypothetical protein COLO4_00899, partial [Corchorus olitorius]